MDQNDFIRLLGSFNKKELTEDETLKLNEYLSNIDLYDLPEAVANEWLKEPSIVELSSESQLQEEILTKILAIDKEPIQTLSNSKWPHFIKWIIGTAAVLVIMSLGVYYFTSTSVNQAVDNKAGKIDLALKGILMTTEDGKTILISKVKDSVIQNANGTSIHIKNGQIFYDQTVEAAPATQNTISTTAGQLYNLNLPDGTKVWLNALSSISFPSKFEGNTRQVNVSGEVYFEVEKDKFKPFKVKTPGQLEVVVLGTHFNINAYKDDQSINTTLIEGQIKLNNGANSKILSPGQQALVLKNQNSQELQQDITVINHVNIEHTIAWVNGMFHFDNLSFQEVSKELERWYDIRIIYKGKIPNIRFRGEMDRGLTLQELQKLLLDWGIETRLEEKKLIVL